MRGAKALLLLVVCGSAASEPRRRVDELFLSQQQQQQQLPGEQLGAFPDCEYERSFTLNLLTDRKEIVKELLHKLLKVNGNQGRKTLGGIEVGALHEPSPVPAFCNVTYVDFVPKDQLDKVYKMPNIKLPDIIDSADRLDNVASDAYDFLIAFHVYEHVRDFVGAIVNGVRVLRQGGLLFFAVPSMCMQFDRDRVLTAPAHMLEEYHRPELQSDDAQLQHHREWGFVRHRVHRLKLPSTQPLPEGTDRHAIPFDEYAKVTSSAGYPIHYHTFLPQQVYELLHEINAMGDRPLFRVVRSEVDRAQSFWVLQKLRA